MLNLVVRKETARVWNVDINSFVGTSKYIQTSYKIMNYMSLYMVILMLKIIWMRSWLIFYALLHISIFGAIILYSCLIEGKFNYSFQTSVNQQDHSGTTNWKGWEKCGSGSIYPTIPVVVGRYWRTEWKTCKYFWFPDQELSPNPPAYESGPLLIYQDVSPHVDI
jgi:hypothetical protein